MVLRAGGGWGIILGRWEWLGKYFWEGGNGSMRHYVGWVGIGGKNFGWVGVGAKIFWVSEHEWGIIFGS